MTQNPAAWKIIGPVSDQMCIMMKSRGWTQERLAHEAGLYQQHISRVLRANVWPNLRTLHCIAQTLDCDLEITLKPKP